MPKFTDDLFDHLTPPDTIDWTLDVSYPKDNPDRIVLALKWAGQGTTFFKEAKALSFKPLPDAIDNTERLVRLFAKHAVAGWRNVLEDGKPSPFNAREAADLLAHILRARGQQGVVEAETMMGYAASPSAFRRPAPVSTDDLGKE